MSEIEDFEEQLTSIMDGIRAVLTSEMPKLRGADRIEKCTYLKNRANRCKQLLQSVNLEIRSLPADQAVEWTEKAKKYDADIKQILSDIEWADRSTPSADVPKPKNMEEMTAKELTTQALMVQEQSLAATDRIKRTIAETTEIAIVTSDALKGQGEQLNRIDEQVDQAETNLKRADKQIRAFMRRMGTDRIILVLIFLVLVAIIAIIVYKTAFKQ